MWLGNDETHYVRKWEASDISDLKMLIDLTAHWMTSELLTERYLKTCSGSEREEAANGFLPLRSPPTYPIF